MKTNRLLSFALTLLAALFILHSSAWAQGTAFTYQGNLTVGSQPANGSFDMAFSLYNAASAGTQVGAAVTNLATGVTNGLFMVTLDFGPTPYNGQALWLQIAVSPTGSNTFTTLSPLQLLTSIPYAVQSLNATTASNVTGPIALAQLPAAVLTNGETNVSITGTFSGNGAGLASLNGSNLIAGSVGTAQLAGGTLAAPVTAAGTNVNAEANTSYVATNASQTIINLPASANVGDIVQISATGAGGSLVTGKILGGSLNSLQLSPWIQTAAPAGLWVSAASSSDGTHLVAVVVNGGIYTSSDSGGTWTQTSAPSESWSSVASSSDGAHLAAVIDSGGIYTSSDSGGTWTQANAPPKFWNSVASSSDGTHLVAVTYEGGVYTSTDSGGTWTQASAPAAEAWQSVASSSDGTHLAAVVNDGGGIYTSTNSGGTWTQTSAPSEYWQSVASSSDGTHLVALVPNVGIYTSANGGGTWINTSAPAEYWVSATSSSDGTLLAAAVSDGGIYISTNSGATWMQSSAPSEGWSFIASSSDGTQLAAVVAGGGIFTARYGVVEAAGTSQQFQYAGNGAWQLVTVPNTALNASSLPSIVVTNGATHVSLTGTFTGSGAGLTNVSLQPVSIAGTNFQAAPNTSYVATNASQTIINLPASANVGDVVLISATGAGGSFVAGDIAGNLELTPWTQTSAPSEGWSSMASSSDGTHLVAVVNGGGIYTSANSGSTWMLTSAPSTNWASVASSSDGTHLVAVDFNVGIYTSTNSGGTWTQTSAPVENWNPVASSSDGTHLVAGAVPGGIYTSTNGGGTWTQTSAPTEAWISVASSSDGTHLVAAVYLGGIYTSTDSGGTWAQTSAPAKTWTSVASSSDGTHLVAVTYSDIIWTSADSGGTWINTSAPIEAWSSVASSSDGTHLVATANNGIFTSTDSGFTWSQDSASGEGWNSVASSSDGRHLVAGLYNGGIFIAEYGVAEAAGTSQEFQYAGNGVWQFVTVAITALPSTAVINGETGVNLTGTFSGNGAGLTGLTLPSTVAFLNSNQTFTGTNAFSHPIAVTNTGGTGGVTLYNNNTATAIGIYNNSGTALAEMGVAAGAGQFSTSAISNDVVLRASQGGTQKLLLQAGGGAANIMISNTVTTVTGTFNNNSDRNTKKDFAPVSPAAMLDKVAGLPLTEWSYKTETGTRHVGPMAQDFYSTFNVGTDDRHIAPIDEGGVALAAIQGLNQKLNAVNAENAELKAQLEALCAEIKELEEKQKSAP